MGQPSGIPRTWGPVRVGTAQSKPHRERISQQASIVAEPQSQPGGARVVGTIQDFGDQAAVGGRAARRLLWIWLEVGEL